MDTRDGKIGLLEEMRKRMSAEEFEQFVKPIDPANLQPKVREMLKRTGSAQVSRNSRCPCGSGKRFKRCCMQGE